MSWTGFTTELTNTVEHLARIVDEIDPEDCAKGMLDQLHMELEEDKVDAH